MLAKQNEIVSLMEPYINCLEAIAAMKAVDAAVSYTHLTLPTIATV